MKHAGMVFALLFAVSTISASADGNTGALHGTAWLTSRWLPVAPSSERLPNVTVKVESPAAFLLTRTNAQGQFAFLTLPPGEYEIRVFESGYFALCYTAAVHANQNTFVDIGSQRFTGGSVTTSMVMCREANPLRPGVTADVYNLF